MPVNQLAEKILKKYMQPGDTCAEDIFRRVARVVAIPDVLQHCSISSFSMFDEHKEIATRVAGRRNIKINKKTRTTKKDVNQHWDERAKIYYDMLASLDFMAASPFLLNAGKPGNKGMLASCFFLHVPDSMEGILDRVKDVGLISKLGGGVGLDISDLRPQGTRVKGTNGTSSGPVSFLKIFDACATQIEQGGLRRAALLACMRIDHPDVIQLIKAKEKEGEFKNFNFSILISDEFMNQLNTRPNTPWVFRFEDRRFLLAKDFSSTPFDGQSVVEKDYISAKDLWDIIINHAHANGEPGILFDDKIQAADPLAGAYGKLGVNPCSELTLLSGESCILGSINLSHMIKTTADGVSVDFDKLDTTIKNAVRFLDNAIDVNFYPLKSIEETTLKFRKIGLGTMGLHDLLLKLKYTYGEKDTEFVDKLYACIKNTAETASTELGATLGIPQALQEVGLQRRNVTILTIPPTGTTSIICGCSSGIEPVFRWKYERNDSYGTHAVRHFMIEQFPDRLPDYAKTADEISPENHLRVQAAAQKHVHASISKTINLPNSATVDDVSAIYKQAYALNCKSVTVYRSGSRKEEVLKAEPVKKYAENNANTEVDNPLTVKDVEQQIRRRPPILFGATYELNTPGGKAFITINEDDKGIRECFITVSKAGSEIGSHVAAIGRLISNSLQYNVPVETIIEHLKGQKSTPVWVNGQLICSVSDAIGKALDDYKWRYMGFSELIDKDARPLGKPEVQTSATKISVEDTEACPECGETIYRESGCKVCKNCGYSKCAG